MLRVFCLGVLLGLGLAGSSEPSSPLKWTVPEVSRDSSEAKSQLLAQFPERDIPDYCYMEMVVVEAWREHRDEDWYQQTEFAKMWRMPKVNKSRLQYEGYAEADDSKWPLVRIRNGDDYYFVKKDADDKVVCFKNPVRDSEAFDDDDTEETLNAWRRPSSVYLGLAFIEPDAAYNFVSWGPRLVSLFRVHSHHGDRNGDDSDDSDDDHHHHHHGTVITGIDAFSGEWVMTFTRKRRHQKWIFAKTHYEDKPFKDQMVAVPSNVYCQ